MYRTVLSFAVLATLACSGAALASEPSAYGLATHAAMRGTLNDTGHAVVHPAVYFAEGDGGPTVEQMTREQMSAELVRMQAEGPPSLVGPIVLTSIGGAMLITGLVIFDVMAINGYYTETVVVGVLLGLGLAIAGGVMLAIGIVRLVRSAIARGQYTARLDDINRRLGGNIAPVPGGNDVPPPPPPGDEVPPPPPPGALWNTPQTSIVVASF